MPLGLRCQVLSLRACVAGQWVRIMTAVPLPESPGLADDQNYLRTDLTSRVIEFILEAYESMNAVDPVRVAQDAG